MDDSMLTALRWSRRCNDEYGIGYLGPSVRRFGPLAEIAHGVEAGLLRCVARVGDMRRTDNNLGYWITNAGRKALADET